MTQKGHDDERVQELRPLQTGVAEVQRAVKELETAAWREGIDPEGLLGTFVLAQSRLLVKTAHLLASAEAAMAVKVDAVSAQVEAAQRLGEIELAKVREMNKSGMVLVEQVRAAIVATEVQYDDAFKRQVAKIGEKMIGEFKDWRVIIETAYNAKMRWKWAIVASVLTVMVVGLGYSYREWEDQGATSAMMRCAAKRVILLSNGHYTCDVEAFWPKVVN
jgi:hypothetical protein